MSQESIQQNEVVGTRGIERGERNADIPKSGHQRYLELGGIINEKNYQRARDEIDKMKETCTLDRKNPQIRNWIGQALGIARHAGIELKGSEDAPDKRIVLYVILHNNAQLKDVYHPGKMSDQQIFGEVLRILGDADSLAKLIKACPGVSSEYERGE